MSPPKMSKIDNFYCLVRVVGAASGIILNHRKKVQLYLEKIGENKVRKGQFSFSTV